MGFVSSVVELAPSRLRAVSELVLSRLRAVRPLRSDFVGANSGPTASGIAYRISVRTEAEALVVSSRKNIPAGRLLSS
jgi:hypothetical protein